MPRKDTAVAYLLWFFLGMLGIHQFYLGRTGWGVGYLVATLLGLATSFIIIGFVALFAVFVMLIVDLFLIPSLARDANRRLGYQF